MERQAEKLGGANLMADSTQDPALVSPTASPRVNVTNGSETISVDAGDLADAQDKGYHPESDQEYYHRKRVEKYDNPVGQIEAGLAGAARGLTWGGGSDIAGVKTGLVHPETLEALKDVFPATSIVSEIGSTVAGAALGGESLWGRGVTGGAKIGEAAGGWIAKHLGETALAKVAGTVGGAAAEGGLYGLGQVASEDALGEHDLTAEHIISTVGLSMLMGGGMAAGLHGAGWVIKKAAKLAQRGTEEAAGAYANVANKLGADLDPEMAKAVVSGGEGGFQGTLSGPKWNLTPEGREQIASDLGDGLQHVVDTAKDMSKQASGARPKEVRSILEAAEDNGVASGKANELADTIRNTVKEMSAGAEADTFDGNVAKRIKRYLEGKPKKSKLGELAEGLTEEGGETLAEDAMGGGQPSASSFLGKINKEGATPADIFDAANELKRKLADEARFDLRPDQLAGLGVPEKNSISKARDLYHEVQNHLESTDVYGEAGARQASYNRATKDFIDAQKQFLKRFGSAGELDRVKINTYLNQIGTARGLQKENALQNYLDKAVGYIGEAGKTLKATGSALDDVQALNKVSQVNMMRTKAVEALGQISKMRALGFGMPLMGEPDRIISGMIHMEPQSITGLAIKAAKTAMSPAGVVKVLASVNRAAKFAQNKIIAGAERLLSTPAGKTVKSLVAPLSVEIANQMRVGRKEDMPDGQTVDKTPTKQRAKEILETAGNPDLLQKTIERAVAGLDQAAPKLTSHIAAKMTGAVMFLASKAQEMGGPETNAIMPAGEHWDVPQDKLSTFQRYLAAVQDPHSVMEDAAKLRLTPEGVEALQAVYPRMYQQMQQATVQRLSQMKTPLTYAKRISIGQLIGVPLDYLQDPANLAIFRQSLQSGDATSAAQDASQSPAPTKSINASKIKSVTESQTTTDRLMAG